MEELLKFKLAVELIIKMIAVQVLMIEEVKQPKVLAKEKKQRYLIRQSTSFDLNFMKVSK